jgi:hypothetical protein
MNSTSAIFSGTHFDFPAPSIKDLQDLIDELESFIALERRKLSPQGTPAVTEIEIAIRAS